MEVATGTFPYRRWDSVFEQLCQVRNKYQCSHNVFQGVLNKHLFFCR